MESNTQIEQMTVNNIATHPPKCCPGVCVADSISCFCEAILDTPSLCGEDRRCCVEKKILGVAGAEEQL